MIRILLCLILIGGSAAMAKDGLLQVPKGTAPIDPEEQFWSSEEGQDIQRLFEEFRTGKKTHEQAFEEYNKKWADKPLPNAPAQVPSGPFTPVR